MDQHALKDDETVVADLVEGVALIQPADWLSQDQHVTAQGQDHVFDYAITVREAPAGLEIAVAPAKAFAVDETAAVDAIDVVVVGTEFAAAVAAEVSKDDPNLVQNDWPTVGVKDSEQAHVLKLIHLCVHEETTQIVVGVAAAAAAAEIVVP